MPVYTADNFVIVDNTVYTNGFAFYTELLSGLRQVHVPNFDGTLAMLEKAQVWTGRQTITTGADSSLGISVYGVTGGSALRLLTVTDQENVKTGYLVCSGITGASRTWTLPDSTGTFAFINLGQTWSAIQTFDSATLGAPAVSITNDSSIAIPAFKLSDNGTGFTATFIQSGGQSANATFTFPNSTGNLVSTSSTDQLNNKTLLKIKTAFTVFGLPVIAGSGANPPAINEIGKVSLTNQLAAIAATNLTNTTPAGLYNIIFYLSCTTANATDGTIGFQINYTDRVGATNQTTTGTLSLAATSTGTTALKGEFQLYLASGNITYQTNLTGAQTTSRYSIDMRCEFLG